MRLSYSDSERTLLETLDAEDAGAGLAPTGRAMDLELELEAALISASPSPSKPLKVAGAEERSWQTGPGGAKSLARAEAPAAARPGVFETDAPEAPLESCPIADHLTAGERQGLFVETAPADWDGNSAGLLNMLRDSLPYWDADGMNAMRTAVRDSLNGLLHDEVNARDADTGDTPLLLCAQYGAAELVELLVDRSADANAALPSGATALHYMTHSGAVRAVNKLLQSGADSNRAEQHSGATPLHYAADAGNLDVCRSLVRHGADTDLKDFSGCDAATYARGAGHAACERFLVSCLSGPSAWPPGSTAEGDSPNYSIGLEAYAIPRKTRGEPSPEKKRAPQSPLDRSLENSALERELAELQQARATLQSLEQDRSRFESAAKATHLAAQLAAVELELRAARDELRAARDESVAERARKEAGKDARDRVFKDLKEAQADASRAVAAEASAKATAAARLDEAHRACSVLSKEAAEAHGRAIAAETHLSISRANVEAAQGERDAQAADLNRLIGLEAMHRERAEAAITAMAARKAFDADVARQLLGDATQKAADKAAMKVVELLQQATTAKVAQVEAKCDRLQGDVQNASKRASQLEAALAAAAAAHLEAGKRYADELRAAAETRRALQDTCEALRKAHARELREEATSLARSESAAAAALSQAERAEGRASSLEAQLVALAQTSSSSQKEVALQAANQAKLDELERQRAEATARADREALRAARAEEDSSKHQAETQKLGERDSENQKLEEARQQQLFKGLDDALHRHDSTQTAIVEKAIRAELDKAAAQSKASEETAIANSIVGENKSLRLDVSEAREQLAATKAQRDALEAALTEAQRNADLARGNELHTRDAHQKDRESAAASQAASQANAVELQKARDAHAQAEKRAAKAELEAVGAREKMRSLEADVSRLAAASRRLASLDDDETRRAKDRLASSEARASAAELEAAKVQKDLDASLRNCDDLVDSNAAQLAATRSQIAASRAEIRQYASMAEQNKVLERRNAQLDQDLTRERISRSKLHNVLEDMKGKIRVIARVRPLSTKETTVDGETASSVVKDGKASVSVLQNNGKGGVDTKKFTFDSVFQGVTRENSQDAFFEDVRALVTSAIDGYNVCLFAYGQTGSGKTYTMGSDCRIGESFDEAAKVKIEAGIAPRAAAAVFELLEKLDSQAASAVTLTMFEIYCDKVVDLLANKSNLELHQKADNLKITLAEHSDNGLVQVQGAFKHKDPQRTREAASKGTL